MRFGASTLMKGTVEEFFDKAGASFEMVEIVCDSPYRTPLEVSTDYLTSVKKTLGIAYSLHPPFADVDIGSLDARVRERSIQRVLEAVEVGGRIGASIVVVHPALGFRGSIEDRDRIVGLEREALTRIHEAASSRQMTMCIENMPAGIPFAERSLASGVMHLARSFEGAGVTFDVGHANTTTVSPEVMLEHLGDITGHVHVHDNRGQTDEHLEVGRGTVGWKAVMATLVRLNYGGTLIDESLTLEAARRGVSFLRRLLEEVRGIEQSG